MGLTKRDVDGAAFDPEGPSWQWVPDEGDGAVPGFGLRLLANGRKVFALRYRTQDGRQRYLTLGDCRALTVDQARKKAKRALGRALDGKDPVEERREARAKRKAAERVMTLEAFTAIYLRRMKDRWAERTHGDYRARIRRNLLPELGRLPLEEITRGQLSALLDRIGKESGPYDSNRTHSIVRAMLNKAQVWGLLPEGHPNPARGIERFRETSRDRWLRTEELERLMAAIRTLGEGEDEEDPGPYFRAFVPLLLFTGMRKSELLQVRWDHVDPERGEVRLPETKSGRPQVRQLSGPAVEILRFLPRDEGNPHVFPGRIKGTHRKDFRNEWNGARTKARLPDVTIHDLRRTAGSYMAQAGVPLQVIGEVLGHQHPAITKVYARLSRENEREALEALGEKLGGLMGSGK